jgi:hypothetical protein
MSVYRYYIVLYRDPQQYNWNIVESGAKHDKHKDSLSILITCLT